MIRHFMRLRWIVIALGVGSVLNIINQGEAIFYGGHIQWFPFILTYLVPYFVSSLSAWFSQ